MLGAIESLMSAVVSDRMSDDRHNPNVELIGQGIANIFSPMFGGLPATGAIARTATNIRSGAQSPVAGMIHALTLLCVLLFAAPLASYIPMAALAGILMVVSYNMGEWREIPQLLRLTKTDISVWLVTFALTVFADLTVAVEAGMILAALLFIARVAETTTVSQVTGDYVEDGRLHILQDKEIPYYATIFRIHGPFLFGATDKISAVTEKMHELPPIVIIRLRNMTAIDATGLFALEEIAKQLHATKRTLILVRRARAAGADDSPGRIRRSCRARKYLRQRSGSPAARRSGIRKHRSQCRHERPARAGSWMKRSLYGADRNVRPTQKRQLRRLAGGFYIVLEHGTNLLPEFRRIRMSVDGGGMQHGQFQHVIFGTRNGDRAGLLRRESPTINYFPCFRHTPPYLAKAAEL